MAKRRKKEQLSGFFCAGPTPVSYNPERDGSLEDYFAKREQMVSGTPLFNGMADFHKLRDEGWFAVGISTIRVMYNTIDDEHYRVVDGFQLEGISSHRYAGKPGVFSPEQLLSAGLCFETGNLYGPAFHSMMARLEAEEMAKFLALDTRNEAEALLPENVMSHIPADCYNPNIHGGMQEYVRLQKQERLPMQFFGPEWFNVLQNNNWLEPRLSIIRVMSIGASDQIYEVTENYKLEGVEANIHGGQEGTHEPATMLQGKWEAQNLRRNV